MMRSFLRRAMPSQPGTTHASRGACTELLPKWRLRNKKITGTSTGVYGSKISSARDVPGGHQC